MDISKLTLGEIAKAEELSGESVRAVTNESRPMGKLLAALAFVVTRRTDPKYTWNDALGLTFDEAQAVLGITDDEDQDEDQEAADPTEGEPTPTKRTRRA